MSLVAARAHTTPWTFAQPAAKLAARGALPGAYGWDLAAHSFRLARGAGVAAGDLLAAALPCSWMVNARATSRVFRRWLTAPHVHAFEALIEMLEGGPDAWLARPSPERERVTDLVRMLCVDGQGIAALSKVLALLCPETMLLMDDSAVWLATGGVARPPDPDSPAAGAEHFAPTLDWFARAGLDGYDALVSLARGYTLAPLDATQVLDRLTWFDTWGWRQGDGRTLAPEAPRWCWVADGSREGVVQLPGPHPALVSSAPHERIVLADVAETRWADTAREALSH